MADDGANPPTPPGPAPDPLDQTAYRSLGRIGQGAAGDVLDAEHIALGKRVVIKLLRSGHARDAGIADRMRLEAQALAKLSHPNIVDVTDSGFTAAGRPFFVMERLMGRTLAEEIKARGAIPVDEAVDIARQLLDGLSAAHAAGIIHRDIKPANLFLCDPVRGHRTLKILDFGIAKILPRESGGTVVRPLALETAEGVTIGTPRFLSPEQAVGEHVDARTDVYGAGMVVYQLVAGRDPFYQVRGLASLLHAHVTEQPQPPSALASQAIPPPLDAAVLRALAKRPADRFASAAEFSEALGAALTKPEAPPASRWLATEPISVSATPPAVARLMRVRSPRDRVQLPPLLSPGLPASPTPKERPGFGVAPRSPSPAPLPPRSESARPTSFTAALAIVLGAALVSALFAALVARALWR